MADINTEPPGRFADFLAQTGGTCVFDGETAVEGMGILLEALKDLGLDPMKTADLREGILSLFRIETINLPDLEKCRLILAPNHVSDLDAVVLGLLHPRIRIVSKSDWADNERLRRFLDLHYDLYGFTRTSVQSLRHLLRDAVRYFNDSDENRHYLVFSQGTISDFNRNSPERISSVAQRISQRTGIPVVTVFLEQVSLSHPTRIVFDDPMTLSPKDDFPNIWLEREAVLQKALAPPARMPVLSYKHANNNKPGDPFF